MRFELVSTPSHIAMAWPMIYEGLEVVQASGLGEETPDLILTQLINNKLFLWLLYEHDKYIGFLTTKKVFTGFNGENVPTLIVHHHYMVEKKYNPKRIVEIVDYLNKHAKEFNCEFIKVLTTRKADRFLKKLGFHKGYTEYIKVVQGE